MGVYYEVLARFITPILMDAGMAFILRWALDSRSDTCIQAGVEAVHALLLPCDIQVSVLNYQKHCVFSCSSVNQLLIIFEVSTYTFSILKFEYTLTFFNIKIVLSLSFTLQLLTLGNS